MSIPAPLKVVVPVVAVPSAVGVSYLVFFKESAVKDSLKSLIEKEGKRIVLEYDSQNHDNIGDEIAKEYKSNSLITVDGISKSNADKTQVKNYCKNTSTLTDANLLNVYRTLCSRGTLIDQINEDLKSQNKSGFTSEIASDWNDLKNAYGKNEGAQLLIPSKEQSNTKVQQEAITNELLMGGCKSVSSNLHISVASEEYNVAKFNCTKAS